MTRKHQATLTEVMATVAFYFKQSGLSKRDPGFRRLDGREHNELPWVKG